MSERNRIRMQGAVAAILTALLLSACGGAAHGSHTAASTAAVGGASGSQSLYRWLVPTTGSQAAVAQENRQPGSTGWRLPGPAADVGGVAYGAVTGYVAAQALSPGQIQRIYVSAPGSSRVRIGVFRIGWYGGLGGREVLASNELDVITQPPCHHEGATGLTECRWRPTLSFRIPPALPSGVYIVRLSTATGARDCLFVVLASHPQPLLAQLPTSTYEAYNAWGGNSLYPGGADPVGVTGTTQGVEVSYDRPYDSITGAGQFFARDVAMVRFLERYGLPVSYTTSEAVDRDRQQVFGHRALIDFGHSEYWSAGQEDAFAAARDAGTNLLLFGSDTLGWRVRYAPATAASSASGRPDHVIVAYKEHATLDHVDATGFFPDRGSGLAGSAYLGCITARVPQPGPPAYRYYSWAPAPALAPGWLFAGTGITAATRIAGIIGYELDQRTPLSPPGTQVVGQGEAPCMAVGATGPGEPVPGPGRNLAQTTIYTARSGALVFATGSLGWELGLEPVPSASPDAPATPDPRLVAMTRNVLAHVLGS